VLRANGAVYSQIAAIVPCIPLPVGQGLICPHGISSARSKRRIRCSASFGCIPLSSSSDYNAQPHWAHRKRDDNRFSPAEVLGWVTNKLLTPEQFHRIFYATRFLRRLSRLGYVHFRRWKLYGEEALASLRWFGCMGMRSLSNTKRSHWRNIPSVISRITSISKRCRKPNASRRLITHRKASFGNSMRRCGVSQTSPRLLPENNGENRPGIFSLLCLKSHKTCKRNAEASLHIVSGYLSVSLHGSVKYPGEICSWQ